jgi:hypothetical protein
MAPGAPAEAGSAPKGAGASGAGGTTVARSERRGWARATGRSEKRTTQGGHVRGDGCGGKCGVERADGRMAPSNV